MVEIQRPEHGAAHSPRPFYPLPALPSVQGRIYAPKTLHQYKWVAIDEQCILWTREKRRGALVHPLIEMTDQVRQCRIVLGTHAERIAAAKLLARQRTPLC